MDYKEKYYKYKKKYLDLKKIIDMNNTNIVHKGGAKTYELSEITDLTQEQKVIWDKYGQLKGVAKMTPTQIDEVIISRRKKLAAQQAARVAAQEAAAAKELRQAIEMSLAEQPQAARVAAQQQAARVAAQQQDARVAAQQQAARVAAQQQAARVAAQQQAARVAAQQQAEQQDLAQAIKMSLEKPQVQPQAQAQAQAQAITAEVLSFLEKDGFKNLFNGSEDLEINREDIDFFETIIRSGAQHIDTVKQDDNKLLKIITKFLLKNFKPEFCTLEYFKEIFLQENFYEVLKDVIIFISEPKIDFFRETNINLIDLVELFIRCKFSNYNETLNLEEKLNNYEKKFKISDIPKIAEVLKLYDLFNTGIIFYPVQIIPVKKKKKDKVAYMGLFQLHNSFLLTNPLPSNDLKKEIESMAEYTFPPFLAKNEKFKISFKLALPIRRFLNQFLDDALNIFKYMSLEGVEDFIKGDTSDEFFTMFDFDDEYLDKFKKFLIANKERLIKNLGILIEEFGAKHSIAIMDKLLLEASEKKEKDELQLRRREAEEGARTAASMMAAQAAPMGLAAAQAAPQAAPMGLAAAQAAPMGIAAFFEQSRFVVTNNMTDEEIKSIMVMNNFLNEGRTEVPQNGGPSRRRLDQIAQEVSLFMQFNIESVPGLNDMLKQAIGQIRTDADLPEIVEDPVIRGFYDTFRSDEIKIKRLLILAPTLFEGLGNEEARRTRARQIIAGVAGFGMDRAAMSTAAEAAQQEDFKRALAMSRAAEATQQEDLRTALARSMSTAAAATQQEDLRTALARSRAGTQPEPMAEAIDDLAKAEELNRLSATLEELNQDYEESAQAGDFDRAAELLASMNSIRSQISELYNQ